MARLILLGVGILFLLGCLMGKIEARYCLSGLPAFVANATSHPSTLNGTSWSIRLSSQGATPSRSAPWKQMFAENARVHLTPASNNKLLTTLATYLNFSPDQSLITPLLFARESQALCIKAAGDPGIVYSQLIAAARALKANHEVSARITKLTLDSSLFAPFNDGDDGIGLGFPASWQVEDIVADYGAPPAAFVLNDNTYTVTISAGDKEGDRVKVSFDYGNGDATFLRKLQIDATTSRRGSDNTLNLFPLSPLHGLPGLRVTGEMPLGSEDITAQFSVLNATAYFLHSFRWALNEAGISVDSVELVNDERLSCSHVPAFKEIATIKSEPLGSLLNWTLKVSDNLHAENFLRLLGTKMPSNTVSIVDRGITMVQQMIDKMGITSRHQQVDGSGLSRHNLISAQVLSELLEGMYRIIPDPDRYVSYLPVGGVSGTLANRFRGTVAQGRVFAKTGSMTGVASLSGVMLNPHQFGRIVFSIVTNGALVPASEVRSAMDAIVLYAIQMEDC